MVQAFEDLVNLLSSAGLCLGSQVGFVRALDGLSADLPGSVPVWRVCLRHAGDPSDPCAVCWAARVTCGLWYPPLVPGRVVVRHSTAPGRRASPFSAADRALAARLSPRGPRHSPARQLERRRAGEPRRRAATIARSADPRRG